MQEDWDHDTGVWVKVKGFGFSVFPPGKAEGHNDVWGGEQCLCRGTVALNLSHSFLIKRLREGGGRGTVTLCLSPRKVGDTHPEVKVDLRKTSKKNSENGGRRSPPWWDTWIKPSCQMCKEGWWLPIQTSNIYKALMEGAGRYVQQIGT
jgi:hypothetical protein